MGARPAGRSRRRYAQPVHLHRLLGRLAVGLRAGGRAAPGPARGELVAVHPIGSTSVPGLAAKLVIDLLPLVRSLPQWTTARPGSGTPGTGTGASAACRAA